MDRVTLGQAAWQSPLTTLPLGECEVKGGALAELAFSPNLAAVPLHDPLHVGKAYARARISRIAVQPLERLEELVDVLHVEADSVVPDKEASALPAELYDWILGPGGKLTGVFQQALQDNAHEQRIRN